MHDAAPLRPSAAAPDCVRSYGVILAGLAAAIARLFLRRPDLVRLTVPLWSWLNRSVRRLERAMTRPVVAARVREVAPPRDTGRTAVARVGVRLPSRAGWLVREFGWEVAAFGSQLQHLLGQPEMQAALAARPAVGRILRPICRMLGVRDVVGLARAPRTRATKSAEASPARVRVVKVRPEVWQPGRAALRAGGVWMGRPRAKRG